MKRIGVLSDTHLRGFDPDLQRRLAQVFAGVDMVLHAGDLTHLGVLESLPAVEVQAVCGNMDVPAVAAALPTKLVVEVLGRRIGLMHGWGSPLGLAGRVAGQFSGVDCVVFGHSHRPMNAVRDGVLLFNPGSVARGLLGSGTVGLLTVDKDIQGQIIEL